MNKALLIVGLIIVVFAGVALIGNFKLEMVSSDGSKLLIPNFGSIRCEIGDSAGKVTDLPIPASGLVVDPVKYRMTVNLDSLQDTCTLPFESQYIVTYCIAGSCRNRELTRDLDVYNAGTFGTIDLNKGDLLNITSYCRFIWNFPTASKVATVNYEDRLYYYPAAGQGKIEFPGLMSGCYLTQDSMNAFGKVTNSSLPLQLQPGDSITYVDYYSDIPNFVNTLNYNGVTAICTYTASGRALYGVKKVSYGSSVYEFPDNKIKDVQCCSYNDCAYGTCDMNTFTCKSTETVNNSCRNGMDCPGLGGTTCNAKATGNFISEYGCVSGACVQNYYTQVGCCDTPVDTCQEGYYCDRAAGFVCKQLTVGPQPCPYECCTGNYYQEKSCKGTDICCSGQCMNETECYGSTDALPLTQQPTIFDLLAGIGKWFSGFMGLFNLGAAGNTFFGVLFIALVILILILVARWEARR